MKSAKLLHNRIHFVYDRLSKAEKRLADLVLEFPGDVTVFSASELATRANTSNATASRLFKTLGYSDYREVVEQARAAQMAGQVLYQNTSLARQAPADTGQDRHVDQDMINLEQTWTNLDRTALSEAVDHMRDARRVWVVGYRNSYFFASYLRRQLSQLRPGTQLLPSPGEVVIEDLADADHQDLAVVIGLRRRVNQLQRIMYQLKGQAVPVMLVTDHRSRAGAGAFPARWTFRCHTRGAGLFDSYVGVTSLLNYVATELAQRLGHAGREHLAAVETINEQSGEISDET